MIIKTYVDALVETLNKDRPDTLIELQDMLHPFKRMGCKYHIESLIDNDDKMLLISIKLTGANIQGSILVANKTTLSDTSDNWYWTSI